ncbi:MAG: hypothetical protein R3181_12890 [Rubricoccaceae bacterium]|nr:hypothetical protein [Rubricoccaceae bacterium]
MSPVPGPPSTTTIGLILAAAAAIVILSCIVIAIKIGGSDKLDKLSTYLGLSGTLYGLIVSVIALWLSIEFYKAGNEYSIQTQTMVDTFVVQQLIAEREVIGSDLNVFENINDNEYLEREILHFDEDVMASPMMEHYVNTSIERLKMMNLIERRAEGDGVGFDITEYGEKIYSRIQAEWYHMY